MSSNEIDPEKGKKDNLSSGEAGEVTEAEMAETMVLQEDAIESVADEHAETTVLDEAGSVAGELRAALEQAEQQLQTYQYAIAEAENKVRRVEREAQQARQFAVERFAGDMLAVLDTLELGIQAGEGEGATADTLMEGNRAGLKQFMTAMKSSGVETIDPEGEPFNPELHEAMVMQPSDTAEPNSVLTVVQRGYLLNGRLLRPARVVVAKAPD